MVELTSVAYHYKPAEFQHLKRAGKTYKIGLIVDLHWSQTSYKAFSFGRGRNVDITHDHRLCPWTPLGLWPQIPLQVSSPWFIVPPPSHHTADLDVCRTALDSSTQHDASIFFFLKLDGRLPQRHRVGHILQSCYTHRTLRVNLALV